MQTTSKDFTVSNNRITQYSPSVKGDGIKANKIRQIKQLYKLGYPDLVDAIREGVLSFREAMLQAGHRENMFPVSNPLTPQDVKSLIALKKSPLPDYDQIKQMFEALEGFPIGQSITLWSAPGRIIEVRRRKQDDRIAISYNRPGQVPVSRAIAHWGTNWQAASGGCWKLDESGLRQFCRIISK